jgi:hypothetical protein
MSDTFSRGDLVEVRDGSEAHGEKGVVSWVQADGLVIVELAGCVWPVTADELRLVKEDQP